MTDGASPPPAGLPDPLRRLSRVVRAPGRGVDSGRQRTWHVLDTAAELDALGARTAGTILAVHGNPTWSYLWRELVAASLRAAATGGVGWRVVAVDQLDMGFSERTGVHRPLAQRVADLAACADALGIDGPVVTLGHDWGGVISLGWAVDHPDSLAAVALLNTAVHHPENVPIPAALRLARSPGIRPAATVATGAFLEATLALAHPPLRPEVKDAYRAPYRTPARRRAIGGFVADIPVDAAHESVAELRRIAGEVATLTVPALLLWGPEDPIFGDRYLDDLVDRLPHADVHRFEGAGHLVAEDRPYAEAVLAWLDGRFPSDGAGLASDGRAPAPRPGAARSAEPALGPRPSPARSAEPAPAPVAPARAPFVPLWHALEERAEDDGVAVLDLASRGGRGPRQISWRQLDQRVRRIAAGLHRVGVRAGNRVSLLVPPGPTLTAVLYACLRIGAVVVVADAGLGVRGLTRAVRGAWPDVVVAERPGLLVARALGWPGVRISATPLARLEAAALGVRLTLADVEAAGDGAALPAPPAPADDAAILFTSGSTGPAKGVVYTHGQLSHLRDALAAHLRVTADTGLVTGFAPFALLGPTLGTRSVTPDMDVSAPRTLTATAVAAAVRESDARIVFLSPAAVLNVVATAEALTAADRAALARVETFLSTGAPIGVALLESIARLMPNATPHTPYGMTECLLVTDVTLAGLRAAADAADRGVCVGTPLGASEVLISALDADGRATGAPCAATGVLGEIVVSAPHLKDHYDRLWLTDRAATRETGGLGPDAAARWHRTGDLGHLDERGRVWVEGRTDHVLVTAHGPLAPVGPEQDVEAVSGVRRAAVVGVGPRGAQVPVAVVETVPRTARPALADPDLTAAVRAGTRVPLAAVLAVPQLPTDIRHNSKIDRTRLAAWAARTLAGRKPGAP